MKQKQGSIIKKLTAGLLLEENLVVLISIRDAIISISFHNSEEILQALYKINLLLQNDMINSLAQFCATMVEEPVEEHLKIASSAIGYDSKVLLILTQRFKEQFSSAVIQGVPYLRSIRKR